MHASPGSASHQALLFPSFDGFPCRLGRMRKGLREGVWQHLTEDNCTLVWDDLCLQPELSLPKTAWDRTSSPLPSAKDVEGLGSASAILARTLCLLQRFALPSLPKAFLAQPCLGK